MKQSLPKVLYKRARPAATEQVAIGVISSSLEDYLEIIYRLTLEGKTARVRDIARLKKVAMSSVTSALKKLGRKGLVSYEAREIVSLSEKGENLARLLSDRHQFLNLFLREILGVDPKTAARDACMMEHVLSAETMEKLLTFSRHFSRNGNSGNKTSGNSARNRSKIRCIAKPMP